MVSIYYNAIDIPSFQSSHIRFYAVPVWLLYGSLHMPTQVSVYHDGIDHPLIPKFAHTVLYGACTVPIWFFTHAYTGCQYTIMALTSPHSKVRTYGSIWFQYGAYTVLYTCLHRYPYTMMALTIPSFQSSHIRFYTVLVQFLYGSLHMPTQGVNVP